MKELYFPLYLSMTIICFSTSVRSAETEKCYFLNDKKENDENLMKRISPLIGQTFTTHKDGYNYVIAICTDVPNEQEFTSITKSKNKDDVSVLGRRNDTQISGGDAWLIIKYGSGDSKTNEKCLLPSKTSLFIFCHPDHNDKTQITLIEDGCNYEFILPISTVCDHKDEMSGIEIFFIIFAIVFSAYCLIGIFYRRLAYNAQGCQQLPHFKGWSKIGNILANGCNYACRCDSEQEDSWNNITRHFDNGDRDDALLRP